MPTSISGPEEVQVGDIVENCSYHPCIVVRVGADCVDAVSAIDFLYRTYHIYRCMLRKLTPEEAIDWVKYGPSDVDASGRVPACVWLEKSPVQQKER